MVTRRNAPRPHILRPKVMRRAHWDEERELWVLERLSDVGKREEVATGTVKRPVSASGQRRPMSEFAKVGCVTVSLLSCGFGEERCSPLLRS